MTLSEFTLRIILIFLPGLISFMITEQLTVHKETQTYRFFIYSLMLGFLCYLIYYLISLKVFLNSSFYFIQSLSNNQLPLNFWEIFWATMLSIPLGFLVSFFINKKILHKIAKKIGASKKFGDLDVWSYIMNSQMPEWVVVRDKENNLMYEGWVHAFSESTERDELFLKDVRVFTNDTAQELYEVPALYLPRNRDNLIIEFPTINFPVSKKKKNVKNQEVENE